LRLERFTGPAVVPYLDAVAHLRMQVFAAWPYLYQGDAGYEHAYLASYARSPRSVFVLAFDGDAVVGASTGIPLDDDAPAFAQAFEDAGIRTSTVFYFGESVLLPAYRGQGIGHAFFDRREAHARDAGFPVTAFCSVERDAADARKPAHYRANDAFWRKRGYVRQRAMFCSLEWREAGAATSTSHQLRFWLRTLPA
jgi:GNAT superfamily N-acetyltransferase